MRDFERQSNLNIKNFTPLILFDGTCALCNGWVEKIYKWDREKRFFFAVLQSESVKNILKHCSCDVCSVILVDDNNSILDKSGAVLEIVRLLGFPYSAIRMFCVLPKKWRDGVYDFIAENRIRLFGERKKCFLPKPEDRHRFIN